MMRSIGIRKEPNFQRIVLISATIHLILIILTFIPIKTGKREFKSYYVNLVGPVEISKGGLKAHGEIQGVDRHPISKDTITTKPIDSRKAEAITKEIERLRAIRELSRRKQGREEEVEIIRKRVNEEATGIRGRTQDGGGVDSNSYYAIISEMIWSKWVFPDIESSGLEVIVSIRIDGKGNILSQEIEKTSGNALFDQSALRAISKANPLPPPPMGIETEVGVRFYL